MCRKPKKSAVKNQTALAKGQIWKAKDVHVRIVELGKRLVHYKILRDLGQMRRTQMSTVESMQDYLKTNKALLVEDVSRN
jgi:hypothetical protein